jgi:ATP-dependent DNA helicase RecG
MATLNSALPEVVGGRTAKALLKAFGMETVRDLLAHYPRRLAERGELTELRSLRLDEDVTVLAEVQSTQVRRSSSGPRLEVVVGDGTGRLHLVFFGPRSTWRERELTPGRRALFSGRVGDYRGKRQLVHPEYLLLRAPPSGAGSSAGSSSPALDAAEADVYAGRLIPVYPATQHVRTWTISAAVRQALAVLDEVPDPLDAGVRDRHELLGSDAALRAMHEPEDRGQWAAARRRLAWDEALGVQLALAQRRWLAGGNPTVPRPPRRAGLLAAFDARLPFTLTAGELADATPMNRLRQGEVGSGKTVVAVRAMLQAVDAGGQAALLAPTEVLAAQHARTVTDMLGPLAQAGQLGGADTATRVVLLTGSQPAAVRRRALLDVAGGAAGIVIGTHALIQQHVSFADLALVVVDEQHRFGVEQRDALRGKARTPPHMLVMTATPIPRTVAMTVFGDLETSTLTELPAGRAPITTSVVPAAERPGWLERAWQRIREEVGNGRQAYVVCPRIGGDTDGGSYGDEDDDVIAALEREFAAEQPGPARRAPLAVLDVIEMLTAGPLQGLRVAALHGRLPPDEKDRTMTDFAGGHIDVLVATTVVEVGVDVGNATVMAILDADRFGVSQLHQLRGRVGRGGHPGLCLLVTDAEPGSPARVRLDAVAATTDGFELARLDVEQRREGDVLGAAQSGRRRQLRLLSLLRDEDLITAAREEATALVAADPTLADHSLLAEAVAALVRDDQAEYLEKA